MVRMSLFFDNLSHWLGDFAPSLTQMLFWLLAGCVTIGWLRPAKDFLLTKANFGQARAVPMSEPIERAAPLFAAFRNTLLALIGLFAV